MFHPQNQNQPLPNFEEKYRKALGAIEGIVNANKQMK
jgi:hypothetical protein